MNNAIQKMFEPLAGRYELVNHVVTFGLDTVWRKKAAGIAAKGGGADRERVGGGRKPGRGGARRVVWLDVSTGTGEMAELLSRRADSGTTVLAADFSLPMLRPAGRKTGVRAGRVLLVAADDRQLPLRDASLDLITISLGTRNLNTSRDALVSCFGEFRRALRPGGRLVNLETSQPSSRVMRAMFHGYVRWFVKPAASALSGHSGAYSYLASSMCSFYEAEELAAMMREAGFARVEVTRLFPGAAAIHLAEK